MLKLVNTSSSLNKLKYSILLYIIDIDLLHTNSRYIVDLLILEICILYRTLSECSSIAL